jgi:hypothetical protein
MGGNKKSLSSKRAAAEGRAMRNPHVPENFRDKVFTKQHNVDHDRPDTRKRVPMPYASTRSYHGTEARKPEHIALYVLHRANPLSFGYNHDGSIPPDVRDFDRVINFRQFETWYVVRYSPARHKKEYPPEFEGLAVHPRKVLRDLTRYYVPPPERFWETRTKREAYQRQVRDYIRDTKGRLLVPPRAHPPVSQINGQNGTALGTCYVERLMDRVVFMFHPYDDPSRFRLYEELDDGPEVCTIIPPYRHPILFDVFYISYQNGYHGVFWEECHENFCSRVRLWSRIMRQLRDRDASKTPVMFFHVPGALPESEHHRIIELFLDMFIHGYHCQDWVACNNEFVRRMGALTFVHFELTSTLNGSNGSWTNSDDVDRLDAALLQMEGAAAFDNLVNDNRGENNAARNRRVMNHARHARARNSDSGSDGGRRHRARARPDPPPVLPVVPEVAPPIDEPPAPHQAEKDPERPILPLPVVQTTLYSLRGTERAGWYPIRLIFVLVTGILSVYLSNPWVLLLLLLPILGHYLGFAYTWIIRALNEFGSGYPGEHDAAQYEHLTSYDPLSKSYLADLGYNSSFRDVIYAKLLPSLHAQYSRARVDNASTQSAMIDWCYRECDRLREADEVDYLPLRPHIVTNTVLRATTDVLIERRRLEVHTRPRYGIEVLGW